tara:strand:- start:2985 stop:3806 length:822 start_codon:yes stop_codon:yes gene_type:complete
MGIDYKKKYLKYKNKYLEAKKIYGGSADGADPDPLKKFTAKFWQELGQITESVKIKMGQVAEIKELNADIDSLNKKAEELIDLKDFVQEKSQLAEELKLCDQEKKELTDKVERLEILKTQLEQELGAVNRSSSGLAQPTDAPGADSIDNAGAGNAGAGDPASPLQASADSLQVANVSSIQSKIDAQPDSLKDMAVKTFDKIGEMQVESEKERVLVAFNKELDRIATLQDPTEKEKALVAFNEELDRIAGMKDGDDKKQALAEFAGKEADSNPQ